MTQTELARRAEVTQGTIGQLISGRIQSTSKLYEIARALKTTPEYLTGKADDPDEGYVALPSTADVAADLGLVPVREIDLTLGMGATYLDVPVTEKVRHFPIDWLRIYTRAKPEDLLFAQGFGDSMEPTLRDSDLLFIDCSQRQLNMTDKIWVIAYAECGAVKRLRPVPGGGVEMLSDNPSVPSATAYDGEMHILGRVVATVRKM